MNPIVLLHGALGASMQLESLAQRLRENGKMVYLMNFSGHGGVAYSPQGFGIEIFAEDVLAFLNSEKINQVNIFGYSMGGYVALWLAHLHPQRVGKIVTLGTKFDWSPESAEKEIRKMNADKIEEKVPAFARLLQHRHAPNDWKELLRKTADMMYGLGQKPLITVEILNSINNPVKILLGDQDDMADLNYSKEVAALLSKGTFELLTETPHPIEKVNLSFLIHRF
jgi:Predicted hydrolases or acyltransferases (alpha/beta hydrolase superfamily)